NGENLVERFIAADGSSAPWTGLPSGLGHLVVNPTGGNVGVQGPMLGFRACAVSMSNQAA
ncbi:MAG: hypothetical protein ACXVA7_22410, partial [Isosphaeraceae bacterium]